MSTADTALQYTRAGISVVPIRADGSKAAACAWKRFQQVIATPDEVQTMFHNGFGIAAVTGRVSGHLEAIDFESGAPFHEWLSLIEEHESALAASLVIIQTPSGGHHVVYRCPEKIEGNQKLAMRLDGTTPKVMIETRGEGGYILTVGSPANCHPAGKLYSLLQGDLVPGGGEHSIPTITDARRSLLIGAARSFNEVRRQKKADVVPTYGGGQFPRPGDVFNSRVTWEEILKPHGWTVAGHRGEETLWRRSGKDFSFSATVNYRGSDLLYVFTTNGHPFEHETSYSKFAAHALLNHAGDYKAAARDIAQRFGMKDDRPRREQIKPADETPEAKRSVEPVGLDESEPLHLTDVGNAEFFAKLFGDRLRFDHRRGRWVIWRGHSWAEDWDGKIVRLAIEAARQRYVSATGISNLDERRRVANWSIACEQRSRIDATLGVAKVMLPFSDPGVDWDRDPMLLGTPNGVVNLKTGTLHAGKADDRITLQTSIGYDKDAPSPRFQRFLREIFQDDAELMEFIHAAVGYSLTGDTSEQVLFLAHGAGSNGKSVFLSTLRWMLGDYGHNMPFSTIEMKDRSSIPNDLAALVNRRFVTASETNESTRMNEARTKALTGGDPVTARFLHGEFFTFKPVAKFWLAVNHKPRVSDDSYGFWRRVRLIPFLRQFKGEEIDPQLEQKLREEAPGILAWAVRGCLRWQEYGLKPPAAVVQATEAYREESDPLAAFILERCQLDANLTVSSAQLYTAYRSWAEKEGLRDREILTATSFGRRMKERFEHKRNSQGVTYCGISTLGV